MDHCVVEETLTFTNWVSGCWLIIIFYYCFYKPGYNEYGQLGRGVTCEGLQQARIINAYAKFLDDAPDLVKITKVSCGEYHTAAISDKGEV